MRFIVAALGSLITAMLQLVLMDLPRVDEAQNRPTTTTNHTCTRGGYLPVSVAIVVAKATTTDHCGQKTVDMTCIVIHGPELRTEY